MNLTATPVAPADAAARTARSRWRRLWRTPAGRALSGTLWLVVAAAAIVGFPNTFGGKTGYVVVSGNSMYPTYHSGDLVITWESDNYQAGDVIVYDVPKGDIGYGMSVVHRVVGGDAEHGFQTLGDNNPSADPWKPRIPQIRGEVVRHVPGLGRLVVAARSPLAFALAGALVVCWILWPRPEDEEPDGHGDGTPRPGTAPDDQTTGEEAGPLTAAR